jgi:hypothetical protein
MFYLMACLMVYVMYSAFNVIWLFCTVMLVLYFFISSRLPIYESQPAPKGGSHSVFCCSKSVVFVDFCRLLQP